MESERAQRGRRHECKKTAAQFKEYFEIYYKNVKKME